jgi:hypothetical protein
VNYTHILTDALEQVQQLERLPSCKRIPTKRLIHSCEIFDPSRKDNHRSKHDTLEPFRNLYALQMTACDLGDAQINMPQACTPLLAPIEDDDMSLKCIADCLRELYHAPSSWDLFNHAKSRALFICQAMQSESDKEDQLQVLRDLISVVSMVTGSIAASDEELRKMIRDFHDLSNSMHEFKAKVKSDNQEIKTAVMASWADAEARFKTDMSIFAERILSMADSLRDAEESLAQHSSKVSHTLDRSTEFASGMDIQRRDDVAKFKQEMEASRAWFAFQTEMTLRNFTRQTYGVSRDLKFVNELTSNVTTALRHIGLKADGQIIRMADMHLQSLAFAGVQEENHAKLMQQFGEISAKATETVESLRELSECAKLLQTLWQTGTDLLGALLDRTTHVRFLAMSILMFCCILPFFRLYGAPMPLAVICAAIGCLGTVA